MLAIEREPEGKPKKIICLCCSMTGPFKNNCFKTDSRCTNYDKKGHLATVCRSTVTRDKKGNIRTLTKYTKNAVIHEAKNIYGTRDAVRKFKDFINKFEDDLNKQQDYFKKQEKTWAEISKTFQTKSVVIEAQEPATDIIKEELEKVKEERKLSQEECKKLTTGLSNERLLFITVHLF